jgi:hypothetical protein
MGRRGKIYRRRMFSKKECLMHYSNRFYGKNNRQLVFILNKVSTKLKELIDFTPKREQNVVNKVG